MEAASPPKRMTRARAAAKGATSGATKSATKAATSRATGATASTAAKATAARTSAKRKTREDETEEDVQRLREEVEINAMDKPASRGRGKAKKIADSKPEQEPEPQADDASTTNTTATTTARATRGRKKTTTTTTTTSAAAAKPEPAKTTRTRTRKTATPNGNADAPAEPPKKATRGRPAKAAPGIITTTVSTEPTPGLKSAVSRPAGRIPSVIKKTVTFQEPEKENMVPTTATNAKAKTKTAETAATGMRAKPVRKPATGGRTTRASARAASPEEKKEKKEKSPLSPKKDGQNRPLSRDASSDDELATYEKTPLRRLMKSPVKPPATTRRHDLLPPPKKDDELPQETSEPSGTSVLGSPARRPPPSPWKDSMKSPPKKIDAVPAFIFSSKENDNLLANTPFKPSILQSPAKRPQLPIAAFQLPTQESNIHRSPVKMSLLQSPAKRPMTPFKVLGSPPRSTKAEPESEFEQLFGSKRSPERSVPVEEAPSESAAAQINEQVEQEQATDADHEEEEEEEQQQEEHGQEMQPEQQQVQQQVAAESPAQLEFPGRLSAVLPRHADPALKENSPPVQTSPAEKENPTVTEVTEKQNDMADMAEKPDGEPMDIDEMETKEQDVVDETNTTTPPQSPPGPVTNPAFELREKDLDDQYMSESEDELALSAKIASKYQDDTTLSAIPATPTPGTLRNPRASLPSSALKAANRAIRSVSRSTKLGFTPLAVQFGEWKASSPLKSSKMGQAPSPSESTDDSLSLIEDKEFPAEGSSPLKGFFDDEMRIRAEMETQAAIEAALEADIAAKYDDPEFDDIDITNEDVKLAAEANEMSLMDTDQIEEMVDARAHDDSISDASQEYGDENAVPIDPVLLDTRRGGRSLSLAPQTPMRPSAPKTFHTVSKVPLKPADDSTPRSVKKRSASASKPLIRRPSGLSRNATVISYSPTKDSSKMDIVDDEDESERAPVTPAKSDIWTSMGTPARTPRRDLNPNLLRGAVVFVDVHTSEGSDASTIFVDLLTQMGARCVKSWPWNPTNSPNGESSASKIGITHVVYKDGGKRTLEKVRESGGVVQCVGVTWVLECERVNKWVEEAPYYTDTSLIPRGGRNRRKSMEPKALANVNGTLVTPMKPNAAPMRDCQTVPNHMNRRDSTAWIRSPSDHDEDEDAPGDQEWCNDSILTPVPKTPAPETVAKFAMDITPGGLDEDNASEYSPEKEELLMRTCPPKKATFSGLGQGLLREEKDQSVMMRLMAARRKSLQFAPKIASPLSKAWN
ncbi:hypothetical protein F5X99DRAFT_30806 [Biscogniauxia marginata]|nr:hypothetical protein F5X99DRAFT_30806 [Biscogniauxia marginata]